MDASFFSSFAQWFAGAGHWLESGFKGAGPLALTLAGAVVLLLPAAVWLLRRSSRRARSQVNARRAFPPAEGQLWLRLVAALPAHVVLASLPLARFLAVRQDRGSARSRRKLAALAVDFAVFRADGTISSVVLLDKPEAAPTRAQARLRAKLLDRAGIRTVTWSLDGLPSVETIARQLDPSPPPFAGAGRGGGRRENHLGSSGSVTEDAMAPDTRLAASQGVSALGLA